MIISLDYRSDIPIYLQIRNEIVKGIGTGGLKFGEQLPTVRSLAADTGVNAMTVNKAYALLKSQGEYYRGPQKGRLRLCEGRNAFYKRHRQNGAGAAPFNQRSRNRRSLQR